LSNSNRNANFTKHMKNCTATDKLCLPVGLILIATDIEVYLHSFNWNHIMFSFNIRFSPTGPICRYFRHQIPALGLRSATIAYVPYRWEENSHWELESLSLLQNSQAPIASALRTAVCTKLKSLLELNLTRKSREQNDLRLWPKNSGYPYPAKKHVSESHLQH